MIMITQVHANEVLNIDLSNMKTTSTKDCFMDNGEKIIICINGAVYASLPADGGTRAWRLTRTAFNTLEARGAGYRSWETRRRHAIDKDISNLWNYYQACNNNGNPQRESDGCINYEYYGNIFLNERYKHFPPNEGLMAPVKAACATSVPPSNPNHISQECQHEIHLRNLHASCKVVTSPSSAERVCNKYYTEATRLAAIYR